MPNRFSRLAEKEESVSDIDKNWRQKNEQNHRCRYGRRLLICHKCEHKYFTRNFKGCSKNALCFDCREKYNRIRSKGRIKQSERKIFVPVPVQLQVYQKTIEPVKTNKSVIYNNPFHPFDRHPLSDILYQIL